MLSMLTVRTSSDQSSIGDESRTIRACEAGVGSGSLLAYLQHRLDDRNASRGDPVELYGFDIADVRRVVSRLKAEHPGIDWEERVRRGSTTQWPFETGSFDVVISNQVLEHVSEIETFCSESYRVLRPGGFAVHIFPTRRMLLEPHLLVPLVHHCKSDRAREVLLRSFYALGLQKGGPRAGRDAARDAKYLRESTSYRTWRQVAGEAEAAGFLTVPRYSLGYLTGMLPTFQDRRLTRGPSHRRPRDLASVSIAQWLFSVTLLLQKAK
jgi:SAM-dependent methyltransferase